jgi:hypothetical protein
VSLWFGSAAFLLGIAAPAAFRASDSATNAANVVGAMLRGWHYVALLAPIALLTIEWRRARNGVIALVFAGVMFAAFEAAIDLRIRTIRASSPVPISSLDPRDPIRRRFGLMHGVSSLALVVQILIAAGATVAIEKSDTIS